MYKEFDPALEALIRKGDRCYIAPSVGIRGRDGKGPKFDGTRIAGKDKVIGADFLAHGRQCLDRGIGIRSREMGVHVIGSKGQYLAESGFCLGGGPSTGR